ncbi:hypothetical protein [Streptomyces sp. NPDC014746]|uniref:hypothetical protein n=1 Tax=Streptomyces sp. NPDC014746 TaxID=3364904 RepID=UPI0037001882
MRPGPVRGPGPREPGTPNSPFHARRKVGNGWGAYGRLIGLGDITGDGQGDLLAVNAGGELFRYSGTGQAGYPFAPRASIGTGYQIFNGLY